MRSHDLLRAASILMAWSSLSFGQQDTLQSQTDRQAVVSPQEAGLDAANLAENKTLNVKPAPEPRPALRYRLWLPDHRLKPGAAQLHFMRALAMWNQYPADFREKVEAWTDETKPREAEEFRAALKSLDELYMELHALAMSEDQRWDYRLRELQGTDIYTVILPEVQQLRTFARLLDLRITQQIADGEIDAAVTGIQDGMRLAAFIGGGETLIQQLVGVAVEAIMLDKVEQLMQVENSPNMYWALATLPKPLIDLRRSLMLEMDMVTRVIPLLKEAESADRPDEYWQTAWEAQLLRLEVLGITDEEELNALEAISVSAESPARERLKQSGMDPQKLAAMPAMRAVLLDAAREIEILGDDLVKSSLLPASFHAESAEQRLNKYIADNKYTSGAAIIVGLLFPSVDAVRMAAERQTYFVNRLMTIEALRMHAAAHHGQLPKSLSELSLVPAHLNPFTGTLFEYSSELVDGKTVVTLQADGPEEMSYFRSVKVVFPIAN